jgi:hypothetical protein
MLQDTGIMEFKIVRAIASHGMFYEANCVFLRPTSASVLGQTETVCRTLSNQAS